MVEVGLGFGFESHSSCSCIFKSNARNTKTNSPGETNSECQQIAQLTIGLELGLGLGFRLSNYDTSWIQCTILLVDSHFHFVRNKPSINIRWNKIPLFYWWQYMCIYCGLSQQKLLK